MGVQGELRQSNIAHCGRTYIAVKTLDAWDRQDWNASFVSSCGGRILERR